MTTTFVERIVTKAREMSPKPLSIAEIKSKASGLQLLGQLETYLTTCGYEFKDIEGDKHNLFCLKSRKGFKSNLWLKDTVCIRMFQKGNGKVTFFVQANNPTATLRRSPK